jgi:hypothetical protein
MKKRYKSSHISLGLFKQYFTNQEKRNEIEFDFLNEIYDILINYSEIDNKEKDILRKEYQDIKNIYYKEKFNGNDIINDPKNNMELDTKINNIENIKASFFENGMKKELIAKKDFTIIINENGNENNIINTDDYENKNKNENNNIIKKKSSDDNKIKNKNNDNNNIKKTNYGCYEINKGDFNEKPPKIPHLFRKYFDLDYNTNQDKIGKINFFSNIKEKHILNENGSYKEIYPLFHIHLNHMHSKQLINRNTNKQFYLMSISLRIKHKNTTIVYYSPKMNN